MTDPVSWAGMTIQVVQWAEQRGLLSRTVRAALPKNHILVLGTSGAGKTNFLESLERPAIRPVHPFDRTQFPQKRRFTLSGRKRGVVFYDTPGQALHQARRMGTITDALARRTGLGRKAGFGVINVVAYGYLETGAVDPTEAVKDGAPDPDYLARQREVEIEAASEWLSLVADEAQFVITLATKADLWFPERRTVREHYESGAYGKAVAEAGVRRHSVLEYASVISKFFGDSPVSGSFDMNDLLDLREQFGRQLLGALNA